MKQQVLWIWMQQRFGVGSRRAHEALERYRTPQGLLGLPARQLESDPFLTPQEKAAIRNPDFGAAQRMLDEAEEFGAVVITPQSKEYPDCLRQIHSPPLVLYTQGDLSLLGDCCRISLVGTRTPDEYGLRAAKTIAYEIGSAGGVVVSGIALGIDAASHRGVLEAGGRTVAVLANGLDVSYPKTNRALRELIEQQGLLMTEYPLKTPPIGNHFPIRNRLISGVSMGTIVVQCRRRSGTMHTAVHALSQDRDVYAVPGDIFSPLSEGPNYLLSEGAAPALSGAALMLHYLPISGFRPIEPKQELSRPQKQQPVIPDYLDERQALVLAALSPKASDADTLCEETRIPMPELLSLLTQLELFGLISALPGRRYEAVRR